MWHSETLGRGYQGAVYRPNWFTVYGGELVLASRAPRIRPDIGYGLSSMNPWYHPYNHIYKGYRVKCVYKEALVVSTYAVFATTISSPGARVLVMMVPCAATKTVPLATTNCMKSGKSAQKHAAIERFWIREGMIRVDGSSAPIRTRN